MSGTVLADRSLLRIAGDQPRAFLQGLVTHDLDLLTPARPLWAALLTPQGKALYDFILWDDGSGAVLIDCETASAAGLAQRLTVYRLRRAITIEAVDGAVHWSADATDMPRDTVDDPRLAALGRRWFGRAGTPADRWRVHRLRHGVAEGVAELGSGRTLWLECNADLLDGVSFTKGCYVGQENTARMHYRAKVTRRLAVVAADIAAGDLPDAAAPAASTPAVELRRVAEWGDALRPAWLADTLAEAGIPAD